MVRKENATFVLKKKALWNEVLNDNIYVVCKTPMAKSITNRTLRGYDNIKTNVICNENIVEEYNIEKKSYADFMKKVDNLSNIVF